MEDTSRMKKNITAKEATVRAVAEKAGWSYDFALKQMEDAKKRLGISFKGYNVNNFHQIPVDQQGARYNEILESIARKKEECISETMRFTGWAYKDAEEYVEATKKRLGITYREYIKQKQYTVPGEEAATSSKSADAKPVKFSAAVESIIKSVMEATGWSYEQTCDKILDAQKRTGCSYKEYLMYKMYTLDESTQNELFLVSMSKKVVAKYSVSKEIFMLLCDKELTNTAFSEFLKRPWCVNTKISLMDFIEKFGNSKRLIYKPRRGSMGIGVTAFDVNETNITDVFAKLVLLPEGIVEEYVVQHSVLNSLSASSVNTIRIVTVSSKKRPVTADGKKFDFAYAALRIGGGTSIVDNFHSGGMAAAVDLETGTLVTSAADMDGNVYEKHPMSGVTIKGVKIPYFKEALKLVKEAHDKEKLEGLIGWDVAITENGPVLIEINLRPGVVLLTAPYIAEKKGMKHVMEKYL